MKWSEQRWLKSRVQAWQEAGVVTEAQVLGIEEFENAAERKRASGFELLSYLGGVCIALGIILLIAYNWEAVPDPIRQLGFIGLLAGVSLASQRIAAQSQLSAALEIIWLILPLAGIGLWGQIYNLSGDAYKPLFLWSILAFPVALLSKKTPVRWLHTLSLALTLFVGAFASGSFLNIEEFSQEVFPVLPLVGLTLLWAWCLTQANHWLSEKGQWQTLILALVFLFSVPQAIKYFDTDFGNASYCLFGSLIPIYWAIQLRIQPESGWWQWTARLGLILALFTLTATNSSLGIGSSVPSLAFNIYIFLMLVFGAALFFTQAKTLTWPLGRSQSAFFALSASPFVAGLAMYGMTGGLIEVMGNLLVLGCGVEAIVYGVNKQLKSSLNVGLLTIGGLLLIRFIDYFGTMFQSGVAFVVSGIFLIGLAYALNKARARFMEKMQ
jgi:uncharacterized membrane protein